MRPPQICSSTSFRFTETESLAICFLGRREPDSLDTRLKQLARENHASFYLEVSLAPLRPGESGEFFDALFHGQPRLGPLRDAVARNAEGNPLFMEEVIRTLLETKALIRRDNAWELTSSVDFVPDTGHDLGSDFRARRPAAARSQAGADGGFRDRKGLSIQSAEGNRGQHVQAR